MDGARRWGGLVWVAGGVVFQLVMGGVDHRVPGMVTLILLGGPVALAFACVVGRPWLVWAVSWVAAVLLALDFVGAVADRFGAFGPAGAPGVSWGDWASFTDYTAALLPTVLDPFAPLAAVLATGIEVGLAAGLLLGWQRRWVGKTAAGLLGVYLVTMASALGLAAVAAYAVPVLIGGALLVSTCPRARPHRAQPTPPANRSWRLGTPSDLNGARDGVR